MLNKIASIVVVAALVTALCGTSALANTSSNSTPRTHLSGANPGATNVATDGPANEKLRINMLTLVADAKAGKVTPAERPQIQPARSNNLSKKTKVAIGVGIAVVVVAVILVVKIKSGSFFDCKSRCVL